MPPAPNPNNELERLRAVMDHPSLNGTQDDWTNDLVAAAAALVDCPIGLVSIVEKERQWFKGCIGLNATGTPRDQAFCAYAILDTEPLIVEDAEADRRFSDNPLVTGSPGIRFYAGFPVLDDHGLALGTLCVIDTRTRTLTEEQIKGLTRLARLVEQHISAEKRHQAILSASLDAIVTIDASGSVIEFNKTAERIFGYTRGQALGQPMATLIVPPTLRDAHIAGMKRYLETGEGPVLGKRIEIVAMRKGGEEFPVELTISPLIADGQRLFTAFIRDISETHELNKSMRLTRFTVESLHDMVLWVAPDARFKYANSAACAQLGYTERELCAMRVFDIDVKIPESAWTAHWEELRQTGSLRLDSEHRCADGTVIPVGVSCNFIEHEGEEFNCVVARDISDRKAFERELQLQKVELVRTAGRLESAVQSARDASEAKTAFLAHMSHELRTPLTAVLGFTRILRTGKHDEHDRATMLDRIAENGRSLLEIINSILDLTKIERNAADIRAEAVDLVATIRSAAAAVSPIASEKGLAFEILIGDRVPAGFFGDGLRVRQILINLLGNAVKYTDSGRVELLVEAPDADPPVLQLAVSDTGRGISPEKMDSVFEAFDRGAAPADVGGTGLGLAIVSGLVKLLGGSIDLQSAPGAGSRFVVKLPIATRPGNCLAPGPLSVETPTVMRAPVSVPEGQLAGLRIMLVEDSDHVREVVQYFLRERGASVRLCHHGQEAVDAIRHGESPDVILMDMQMPVLDGYDATRVLRREGTSIPIIALTAHGMEHERDRCISAGCDDYLSKPIDPDELAETCRRQTSREDRRIVTERPRETPNSRTPLDDLKLRFTKHLEQELQFLESAQALIDLEALRRRIHKLAGAAGNLGYPKVTERAREALVTFGPEQDAVVKRDTIAPLCDAIRSGLNNGPS